MLCSCYVRPVRGIFFIRKVVCQCRTSWCKWRCSLEEKRQFLSMDTLALHHWALQLQKKVNSIHVYMIIVVLLPLVL